MSAKILVIDDEESIRFTFDEFLSEEGYEVFCSDSYINAMNIIEKNEPDLIFADIILGAHTGIEILKTVNERAMLCPVIMITGQPDVDTAADSVRLGAFDYLPKPIRQEKLLRVTKIALAHKDVVADKERYRNNLDAIFRSVMDAIITVDTEMRVMESNSAVENVCNIFPENIIGKSFLELSNPALIACQKILKKTVLNKKSVREHRIECKYTNKPLQIFTVNSSPLLNHNKQTIGAVLVLRNVTRISNLENELKGRHHFHNIIGKSKKMLEIYQLVENLADIQTTVLITGESGTGKGLIAKALHYSGPRAKKPLVTVSCSMLVETLLESELFGHVKGAFTGAFRDKIGRFEEADKSSIFLDEIGDISPMTQLKLLRILQEKEFERVGESASKKVDVRLIAATNKNLKNEVKMNRFREDLYYRLKVVEITLPPLRERKEDIPLLVEHFCRLYNERFDKNIQGVDDEVLQIFIQYLWPGNIRELEHAIERAFVFCRNQIIRPSHIPPEILDILSAKTPYAKEYENPATTIIDVVRKTGGNKAKAARILGISRKTLYKKIKKYNLKFE